MGSFVIMVLKRQLAVLLLLWHNLFSSSYLLKASSRRTLLLKAGDGDEIREARVAPAKPPKSSGGPDEGEVKPAVAMKQKEDGPANPAPQAAPEAVQSKETKPVEAYGDVPIAVAKEVKKEMTKKFEEKEKKPAAPLDKVASLIKDLEAGQKPGTEATRKILEEEAKLKKIKLDEFNYLGTGTVVGGTTLGLILGSIVAIQNVGALGADVTNIGIVVVAFAAFLGGGSYAAYFTKQAQNLDLPENVFGSGATLSKLVTDLLGRPTIKNFESVQKKTLDKIYGVKNEIETTVEDTKTSIVTFPDTVKAGIDIKVEETKAEAKAELERTKERLKAAPGELVEVSKNTVNQVAFDLKEAAIRATEQQVEDLKTLPTRTVEGVKASAKSTADNLVNDIKNAPSAIVVGIKNEVEAIPTKAQKAVESQINDIKEKVVGGGGKKKSKKK